MIPSIWPGDILLVQRAAIREISEGEIVLCEREGSLFAHRVVSISEAEPGPRIVTQGDALPSRDAEVSDAEFLGRVAGVSCGGQWREMKKRPGLGTRMVIAIVRRSSFAARVLLHLHAKRSRAHADSREDGDPACGVAATLRRASGATQGQTTWGT